MIRDQANKTLDVYLQRIRKHGSTMPDTVLPPTNAPDTTKEPARIGTSNDKSWAGWAISSFTNKITTAEGEIQPTANGSKPVETTARPASVPRPVKSPPAQTRHPPQETMRPKPPPLGRSVSEQPTPVTKEEEEKIDDVIDAWDAMDDDKEADPQYEDPFSPTAARSSPGLNPAGKPSPVPFDDGGEPDFAGWLAAQSKAKAKKPLPKGLNRASSTASASRTTSAKPKPVAAKKIDTKPKEEEDDDWGAAWD